MNPLEAKSPSGRVSSKYSFISSGQFVQDMEELGWKLNNAALRTRTGFGKHAMRFRHDGYKLPGGDFVELVALTAHDGSCSFRLQLGIFRLVCSNGMVAGKVLMEPQRIRHIGYTARKVKAAVDACLGYIDKLSNIVEAMKATQATGAFAAALVKAGLEARGIRRIYNATELMDIRREEDRGTDQWTVFNRIQEAIVRGGFETVTDKDQFRRARALVGASSLVEVNAAMFDAAIKQAA